MLHSISFLPSVKQLPVSAGRYIYANEPNCFALQTFFILYYYSPISALVFQAVSTFGFPTKSFLFLPDCERIIQ